MAQARIILKALRVKRILNRLARAKENTIRAMVGLPPLMSWYERCCMGVSAGVRECLCRAFCPCCIGRPTFGELCCPKHSCGYKLCTPGQYPNELIKSFLGFLFGLALSVGVYFFMCLQVTS
ncbi:uncharacterized protein LOC118478063 [Aplysia californica]|uniref:Uncharacterized protein LOC118478063 n=1 Tax=Aplysia californica TaxID=6500 RepID=A0ABM1VWV3_APLCA|nr:uncharacterized protein LOC118478063 [Aplysia californica]